MNRTSALIAALALATSGAAMAQGNPPTTAPPNPATAAGQQNPAGGPMGTTGTTPQSNAAAGAGGTMPSSGSMATGSSNDTSMASNGTGTQRMRPARADRN